MSDRCQPVPPDGMPTCPVVASGTYSVSDSGKRLLHGDVCNNVAAIIPDTDGKGNRVGLAGRMRP